ncbi:RimK family alpha-L-glutamate ligase [Alteribacter lacisalsi]|uniref:RimK family alpha-L-glutamate ligase n=1 Tax=Alteribacter lacisalsi TaxID=2045244 RepID=A0A2W0H982_9BACI|nr:RimK family alpha-L-glutamate ligase [Alteribacter lacisalsi]PYZ97326.1 RimK family alpha-L-glutamate ligase [Alteribacter lacisalsi]
MTYGWLVANSSLQTEKFMDYADWMKKEAERQGVMLELVWNSDIPVVFDCLGRRDFALPRHKSHPDFVHFADKDLHLGAHLESAGLRLFNRTRTVEACDSKALMHTRLAGHGIPAPRTVIGPKVYEGCEQANTAHINNIIDLLGLPLIVKEAYGSFGKQVYKAETRHELEAIIGRLGSREIIFQEMITESAGRDVRLNVVGSRVVASMKRTSVSDFRANVSAGGATETWEPSEEEKEIAVKAASAVNADFAGVDLLFGKDGPVLCEINSNPHIRSIYECTGVNVAVPMIEHILTEIK